MKGRHVTVEGWDGEELASTGAACAAESVQVSVPALHKSGANVPGGGATPASFTSSASNTSTSPYLFMGGLGQSDASVPPPTTATLEGATVDTPSSAYEAAVCGELQRLLDHSEAIWAYTMNLPRIILRSIVLDENYAIAVTCTMLLLSCVLYPTTQTILCTILFFILYGICVLLQAYHFWACVTEMKYRTASVTGEVLARWWRRVQEMPLRRSQTAKERRRVFVESFAQLPAKAFRMVAVVDERTDRLKHIHKSLMVKASKRLDEVTLKVHSYLEPTNICKLIDVMHITLESDAIVLRPLIDRARPPRLPNLLLPNKLFVEEEEDTTDDSDHEHESRTALGGGNTISVSRHMEHFVHRVFLLAWVVVIVLTAGTGAAYYCWTGAPLGEGVFIGPAVAALGLLPLNAIVLNRVLIFYANVYLDKLFHYMVSRRSYTLEARLPRFSFRTTMSTMLRVVCRRPPPNGGRNPLVFSTSLVDVFGMATVVAMLDQVGIVTDMVLVPKQVLLLRPSPTQLSSSDNDSDEEGTLNAVTGCFSPRSEREARERHRDMRRQIKRKKYQEQRFLELRLAPSSRTDLAVEFTNEERLRLNYNRHLNPLCLAILVHARAKEPTQLATWTEPFRFCDRSLLWARALHWIPRACGFHDSVARNFLVLARIFIIHTASRSGYRDAHPEQACSYLVEAADGALHLFTMGTPYLVCRHATTHWTGTTIEPFNQRGKAEVLFMGKHQWEEGAMLETVALSHRILPERYRPYVATLPRDPHRYSEYFFRNGVEVNSTTARRAQATLQRRRRERATARAARSTGAAAAAAAASESCDGLSGGVERLHSSPLSQYGQVGVSSRIDALDSLTPRSARACTNVGPACVDGGLPGGNAVGSEMCRKAAVDDCEDFRGEKEEQAPVCDRAAAEEPRGSSALRYRHRRRCASVPPLRSSDSPRKMPPRSHSVGAVPMEPVEEGAEEEQLTAETFVRLLATTSHTFLGLVGLQDSVRPNVQSTVALLDESGVRCMYFCAENERQTKSFGSRVGLETDWNCCISLKEGAVALDPHSIRAQLPFGIKSIRKHILHVDPIPLQVSLFSHSLGVSKRAMLSVLQDNHEVVVAVGSVFNHSNVRSFVQADMSIGVLPTRCGVNAEKDGTLKHSPVVEPSDFAVANSLNRDMPLYRNVAELIGCSCSLRAPPTTSILPIVAMMIRQARLRLSGIGNGAEFVMHANVFLVMVNTVSLIVGAPLLLTPSVTVFELYVLIPILAMCCTYTAYAGMDPMRVMPSRHNHFVRRAIFRHSCVVWCLRYAISLLALVVLGLTASVQMCQCGVLDLSSMEDDVCMSAGQGYVALTFNYWLMVHCWTHISRHHPISLTFSLKLEHGRRSTYLFRSFRWVAVSGLVTVLSVIVVVIDTPMSALRGTFFPSITHFLVALLYPLLLLVLDWPIKRWRERRFTNMQKFRKLSYGTRLGMHSPRGDYEPEGISYAHPTSHSGETEGAEAVSVHRAGLLKRISERFYRFTSLRGGKLELNCVCCDHIGGNYATYHTSATV